MFQALLEPLGREALARVTLLLNHVIAAEPEATRRLLGHVDATVQIEWQRWPAFLPPPPQAVWRITPAGLLELAEPGFVTGMNGDAAQLVVGLDQQALTGWALSGAVGRPPMVVQGDVGLAADISWLAENLRWDLEDDLARVLGDVPARQIAQFGRAAVQAVQGLLQRVRPNPPSAS
jgi:ubiquinone biosynthesis accessory factor UbiJ